MNITSHTPKAIGIGIITILFFIPSLMVQELISERAQRREATVGEVSSKWGNAQTIAGPVLVVPYGVPSTNADGTTSETISNAFFLPEQLMTKGTVKTEIRSRGIYDVPVYDLGVTMSGNFKRVDTDALNVPANRMKWDQAYVHLGIPDMRGVRDQASIAWSGSNRPFTPGSSITGFTPGMRAKVAVNQGQENYPFSFAINLKGSQELAFLPLGKTSTVELTGDWATPSFDGAFLPEAHTVSDTGFTAQWKVLDLNRSFPQQWTDGNPIMIDSTMTKNASPYQWTGGSFEGYQESQVVMDGRMAGTQPSAFGVRLFQPTDVYSQSDRAAKYAMAVIMLVFALVFFIEATGRRRVHPVQYVLIGLALVVFYALLLSLSEYVAFSLAYLIASVAIIGMVTAFVRRVTHDSRRGWVAGGTIAVLYAFVYVLLSLEDYTLLIGSIGLFAILGVLMAASNRVSWYGEEMPRSDAQGS